VNAVYILISDIRTESVTAQWTNGEYDKLFFQFNLILRPRTSCSCNITSTKHRQIILTAGLLQRQAKQSLCRNPTCEQNILGCDTNVKQVHFHPVRVILWIGTVYSVYLGGPNDLMIPNRMLRNCTRNLNEHGNPGVGWSEGKGV